MITLAELRKQARRVFGRGTRVAVEKRGLCLEVITIMPSHDASSQMRYISLAAVTKERARQNAEEALEAYALLRVTRQKAFAEKSRRLSGL